MKVLATLALVCATLSATAAAKAPTVPSIAYGVADDVPKYADDGGARFYTDLPGAGLAENRWTLAWNPANPTAIEELPFLERAARSPRRLACACCSRSTRRSPRNTTQRPSAAGPAPWPAR